MYDERTHVGSDVPSRWRRWNSARKTRRARPVKLSIGATRADGGVRVQVDAATLALLSTKSPLLTRWPVRCHENNKKIPSRRDASLSTRMNDDVLGEIKQLISLIPRFETKAIGDGENCEASSLFQAFYSNQADTVQIRLLSEHLPAMK